MKNISEWIEESENFDRGLEFLYSLSNKELVNYIAVFMQEAYERGLTIEIVEPDEEGDDDEFNEYD